MHAEYLAWFQDVAATRGFEPVRIALGGPRENPTILTRQDWRGPEPACGAGFPGLLGSRGRACGTVRPDRSTSRPRPFPTVAHVRLRGTSRETRAGPGRFGMHVQRTSPDRGPGPARDLGREPGSLGRGARRLGPAPGTAGRRACRVQGRLPSRSSFASFILIGRRPRYFACLRVARPRTPRRRSAAWKRATRDPDQLGKPLEAVISFFNPEMVREWVIFHEARFQLGFDPETGSGRWRLTVPGDDGTLAALITALRLSGGSGEPPIGNSHDRRQPSGWPGRRSCGPRCGGPRSGKLAGRARSHFAAGWPRPASSPETAEPKNDRECRPQTSVRASVFQIEPGRMTLPPRVGRGSPRDRAGARAGIS